METRVGQEEERGAPRDGGESRSVFCSSDVRTRSLTVYVFIPVSFNLCMLFSARPMKAQLLYKSESIGPGNVWKSDPKDQQRLGAMETGGGGGGRYHSSTEEAFHQPSLTYINKHNGVFLSRDPPLPYSVLRINVW